MSEPTADDPLVDALRFYLHQAAFVSGAAVDAAVFGPLLTPASLAGRWAVADGEGREAGSIRVREQALWLWLDPTCRYEYHGNGGFRRRLEAVVREVGYAEAADALREALARAMLGAR